MLNKLLSPLLFYAYALLGAPWFGAELRGSFETPEVRVLPGMILLFALAAETIALPWKFRGWPPTGDKDSSPPLKLGAGICITHVILAYFLGIYVLDAFGVMGSGRTQTGWMAAVLILLFFREGYLFFAAASARRSPRSLSGVKKFAAEVLLLCFRCVAYTAYWEVMMAIGEGPRMHWLGWLALSPALILLFYILYLPIRMTDILGSYYTEGSSAGRKEVRWLLLSGAGLALYPIAGTPLIAFVTGG